MTDHQTPSAEEAYALAMRNVVNQLRLILPLVEKQHVEHWPSCPHCLIEAAIGTLEESLAYDPMPE